MTTAIARAPSTRRTWLQTEQTRAWSGKIELWLETERDQLFLWLPVVLGTGVVAWFVLDGRAQWLAWMAACIAVGLGSLSAPSGSRLRRVLLIAGIAGAAGCAAIWWRAERLAGPVVGRPMVAQFTGRVVDIDRLVAKAAVRIVVEPEAAASLPPRIRITADVGAVPADLTTGETVRMRARLVSPPNAAVPGAYDFSRAAWFQQLGGTGKAIGTVERVGPRAQTGPGLRDRLSAHIRSRIEGSAGGIASAFATGDRGGIAVEDEEAMRASGLTHLLSVSGLHITAVVGATMFLVLRLLALSPWLALRFPLVVIAAGAGAVSGIGYTLLTGAEVPTVRSCVAAIFVMIGVAMGRDAFTLRLVAAGAIVVLILWPEAVVGASFQLSFAAMTAIVALHEHPAVKRWFAPRDDRLAIKLLRGLASLLLTGLVVEAALAPIALFHFHKSGLFGAFANIVAIPLTTFVIMPLEAIALLFDLAGFGAPFWWATGQALELLLALARWVAGIPHAQAALALIPDAAFGLIVAGGLWLMLWRGRVRWAGLLPMLGGAAWALLLPSPDLIVTGDGKHLAVRGADGTLATLRPRAGDYVRSVMGERAGSLDALSDLDDLPGASCGADLCRVDIRRGDRVWRVLATRSAYPVPRDRFTEECKRADIVVSERRLPYWCRPRWFRADRMLLSRTGGLAITLASARVETVADAEGDHPWVVARRVNIAAAARRDGPARGPDRHGSAAPRTGHWRDRAGSSRPQDGNI